MTRRFFSSHSHNAHKIESEQAIRQRRQKQHKSRIIRVDDEISLALRVIAICPHFDWLTKNDKKKGERKQNCRSRARTFIAHTITHMARKCERAKRKDGKKEENNFISHSFVVDVDVSIAAVVVVSLYNRLSNCSFDDF